MKYSYSWLKALSDTKKSIDETVEGLTMHSFEIEGVEEFSLNLPGVIVGEIKEIKKHPDADKLQLVKVDIGKSDELSIVCGAWNIKPGDKVPVAMPGTKLPNGMDIKETEIRGQRSFGMLCAPDELGIGKDHAGIIILEKSAKAGELAEKYLGYDDKAIEIKVLPDRAHDAMSHVGVAREIAALDGRKLDYDFSGLALPKKKSKELKVEIQEKALCPRYIGAVIKNIEIRESPRWMKERLLVSGMNSINNIVDATNYIMLELGQPLHAFDADKLEGEKILIRKAKEQEEINLLDKGVRKLSSQDLLITDGERPAALAGIKGARIAEIDQNTKNIVLESASFDAANIRRTRTRLGIKTESSDRFEKGIDPNLSEKAMMRVIEIILHTAGGELEGIVDVYPGKIRPWNIRLDLQYVNNLLGETVPEKNVIKILDLLDIETKKKKKGFLEVAIPTFRIDLRTQEDLIEEIGRIWGYEKIKKLPILEELKPAVINEQAFFERKLQDVLSGLGFDEVYNYSFYSRRDADSAGLSEIKHIEVANPMNPDQEYLRVSLIPNILKNIRENLKHFSQFRIYEQGRTYWPEGNVMPGEKRMFLMAEVLDRDKGMETFFDMKGSVAKLLESIGLDDFYLDTLEPAPGNSGLGLWHPGRTAEIKIEGKDKKLGFFGEINPLILPNFKINKRVVMAEFDTESLKEYSSEEKIYKPIMRYPTVTRDISFVDAKGNLTIIEVRKVIRQGGGNLVLDAELFDTFKKEGATSHAFHIYFGADRTLEGKEVDEAMSRIIERLEKELKVEIRK